MTTRIRPEKDCLNLSEINLEPKIIEKLSQFDINTVNQLTKITLDCLVDLKYFKSSELVQIRLCLSRFGYALSSKKASDKKQQLEYDYLIAVGKFLKIQKNINEAGKKNNSFWLKLKKITIDDLDSLTLNQRNKVYYGGYNNLEKILIADYRDIINNCRNFGKKYFIFLVEAVDKYIEEKELIKKES